MSYELKGMRKEKLYGGGKYYSNFHIITQYTSCDDIHNKCLNITQLGNGFIYGNRQDEGTNTYLLICKTDGLLGI